MSIEKIQRVAIENVKPQLDCGRFPIKRTPGEEVLVSADIFADGQDALSAVLLYKKAGEKTWDETPMTFVANDLWQAVFPIAEMCSYVYTVEAWVDVVKSWQNDLRKKFEAGQDVRIELTIGRKYIEGMVKKAKSEDAKRLKEFAGLIAEGEDVSRVIPHALSEELTRLAGAYSDRAARTRYERELQVTVDRGKANFSSWYEIFPRSCSPQPGRPGNLKDCQRLIPEIAGMGFNVLYLPPVHPIGKTNRKGKNNAANAQSADPGSPWAIGSQQGGHTAIEPSLGTMNDFKALVKEAGKYGMEIAMDLAFQCSPDHPYIKEYPHWFKKRPDGSIQFAENPPKKYEDIVPFDFDAPQRKELWEELKSIVLFWVDKGVRMFRVDNPHTKPFAFWEWLIGEIKKDHPEVIFLAEAFTRPKVMYRLAMAGFSQSYTYFTWRNTKREFLEYIKELTRTQVREYFRPNLWTNTPDILPEHLQFGGRPTFITRLLLAATLSSNYGIFGPAFELCVNEALPGKEEYLNSEKYEIRHWDRDRDGNLKDLITRVNKIRRENPALQVTHNIRFCEVDNEQMLFYVKATGDLSNVILVVVNLDPYHTQSGWVNVPLAELGIDPGQSYLVVDLLSNDRYFWQGERNYVQLNPSVIPAHILRLHRRLRREADFDYFM